MKRIGCIVIAVLFLALGITATIRDYQKTSQQANKIKDYPVIKASELSTYKEKKKQKVLVTDISISGSRVFDPNKGDLRYTYRGITDEDTMTAVMTVGDGEAVLEPLLESDTANYIVGDKESYYKLINQSFVWESFVFLFFGIGLAGVFLFLAYRCD